MMTLRVLFFICAFFSLNGEIKSEKISRYGELGGFIEDTINKTLNAILGKLPDPVKVEKLAINFDDIVNQTILTGGLNLSSIDITGIKKIVAAEIEANMWTQKIKLVIAAPEILISHKYWADVVLAELVPLYGEGRNFLTFENMVLNITGKFALEDNKICLKNLTIAFTCGSAQFDFNGLLDNPEFSALINTLLDDLFCSFLNVHKEFISRIISPIVEFVINKILGGGPSDFLEEIYREEVGENLDSIAMEEWFEDKLVQ